MEEPLAPIGQFEIRIEEFNMVEVQSWMLVLMMWANNGSAITTAPGLYQTEGACNVAAAKFNDQAPFGGDRSAAVCIPGPKLLMTATKKK